MIIQNIMGIIYLEGSDCIAYRGLLPGRGYNFFH